MGLDKLPDLPDVPGALDLVTDPVKKQVLELILIRQEPGRPVAAPPGVPADRLAVLRRAFDDTMKDPGFPRRGGEGPDGDRAAQRRARSTSCSPPPMRPRRRSCSRPPSWSSRPRRNSDQAYRAHPGLDPDRSKLESAAIPADPNEMSSYRFANNSSRRGASGEPYSLAFSYQLRAFSISAADARRPALPAR